MQGIKKIKRNKTNKTKKEITSVGDETRGDEINYDYETCARKKIQSFDAKNSGEKLHPVEIFLSTSHLKITVNIIYFGSNIIIYLYE